MEIDKLNLLTGVWKGKGVAQYPTIQTVDYTEELVFNKQDGFNVMFYEQKTWVKNEAGIFNKPIFWESGFLIDKGKYIELCSVQLSGRMEVLIGELTNSADNKLEINFHNKNIFNDERMIRSGRRFAFSEREINYEVMMSTKENLDFNIHLKAELKKLS
ncbi:MAG: FABP family protein [Ignavibacterium sp.]|nr:FABP family protein [Ignavibacterium sp.]